MSRIVYAVWAMIGILVLGVWLGLVATARSRADLVDIVFTADQSRLTAVEYDAAGALLQREMESAHPEPQVVAAIWTVLAIGPDAERTRAIISRRSDDLLVAELASAHPDEGHLRLAYDVAGVLGPEAAAAVHARISARAEFRGDAAAALATAAERLRSVGAGASAAATVTQVAEAWKDLVQAGSGADGLTWAARETPPVSDAIATAGNALRSHLELLVATDGEPPRAALMATWACLQQLDQAEPCSPQLVARYAAAVRRDHIPSFGLLITVVVFIFLAGGSFIAYRRLVRGIRPIDPGAETMEAVDPVDTDTEAITAERNPTSEETRVE